jgi:alpha-tubulin suppressor-like RCC1 family protein
LNIQTQISPILVPGLGAGKHGGVVSVASGSSHTLALCGDGKVFSWGLGEVGQLGREVCPLKDAADVYQPSLVAQQHLTPKLMEYQPTGASSTGIFVVPSIRVSILVPNIAMRMCIID